MHAASWGGEGGKLSLSPSLSSPLPILALPRARQLSAAGAPVDFRPRISAFSFSFFFNYVGSLRLIFLTYKMGMIVILSHEL